MSAGASRALRAIILIGCLIPPSAGLLAQEAPAPNGAEAAEIDAHTLAEQAITFDWNDAPGVGAQAAPSPILNVLQVILTLAVVAAAIYGLVFLLKKMSSRGARVSQDPFLKVLATAPVGANRGVHVVSLGSQAWLVGTAEHGVSLIGEITDKETLDAMLLEDSRKSAESPAGRLPDFRSMLRKFGMPADSASPSPENIRKRSERLKGV